MNFELVKKENNQVTLNLTVPYADFNNAIERAYQKEKSKFNIPGFRKGKAPRKTIENNYGEGVFYEEAINIVFPEVYSKAVDELKIDPVARPDIDILEVGKDIDLKIEAVVTVKPEIKLGQYKGVSVEAIKVEISDEDIQNELEKSREAGGRLVNIEDRPVQIGDTINMDYSGFVGDHQFDGGTAENQMLEIGSGKFIQGFEEQLVGANIGDELDVNVTFPEKYHSEELAGKPAVFKVKVNGIKSKELPELDDEFAKDTSEFDTLEELKADMKSKLEESAKKNAEMATRDKVVDAVVATIEADIPDAMVENEINGMLKDFDYELRYQGADLEKYLQFTNTTVESLKEQMRDDAMARVKTSLAIEEIAKLENIEINQEDIESEIARIAERQKSPIEDIRKYFEKDDYEYIKSTLTAKKAVDLIVDSAEFN